jgi:hypothetical protein
MIFIIYGNKNMPKSIKYTDKELRVKFELMRKQTRERQRKFYERHKESEQARKLEYYHNKKM